MGDCMGGPWRLTQAYGSLLGPTFPSAAFAGAAICTQSDLLGCQGDPDDPDSPDNPGWLSALGSRAIPSTVSNPSSVLGSADDSGLTAGAVDFCFLTVESGAGSCRDAYLSGGAQGKEGSGRGQAKGGSSGGKGTEGGGGGQGSEGGGGGQRTEYDYVTGDSGGQSDQTGGRSDQTEDKPAAEAQSWAKGAAGQTASQAAAVPPVATPPVYEVRLLMRGRMRVGWEPTMHAQAGAHVGSKISREDLPRLRARTRLHRACATTSSPCHACMHAYAQGHGSRGPLELEEEPIPGLEVGCLIGGLA
jgi:hypothetical protein